MIIDSLIDRIKELQNPSVVGLDPRPDFIPNFILEQEFEKHRKTPKAISAAIFRFNKEIIDAICDIVPAVKPQIAMYECFGPHGLKCYIDTIDYARDKGLITIGDIKRSDIATTADAYADGHLGEVNIGGEAQKIISSDFITINPYLGEDGIEPFKKRCKEFDRGLFILVKTSNPNSGQIQDIIEEKTGKKIYEIVGSFVETWGADMIGKYNYSCIGAVVGATHKQQAKELRELMPHSFFLVPGYGAQGGTAEDLSVCFDKQGLGAIVNSSRGIIAAYKSEKFKADEADFAKAAREAAIHMKNDLNKYRV